MYVNVRSVGVGRVGVCMLCVCDSEERERGVGVGVNATVLLGTLQLACLAEAAAWRSFLILGNKKKRVSAKNENPP